LAKHSVCGQFLVKNEKVWSKMEIVGQKSNFWSKMKILVKDKNFWSIIKFFGQI